MSFNVAITPADSARNLGVIFISTLSMFNYISAVSKSCFQSIRDLRRIKKTLGYSLLKLLLHLSFTLYLITATPSF